MKFNIENQNLDSLQTEKKARDTNKRQKKNKLELLNKTSITGQFYLTLLKLLSLQLIL